jgi:hypothetical protein
MSIRFLKNPFAAKGAQDAVGDGPQGPGLAALAESAFARGRCSESALRFRTAAELAPQDATLLAVVRRAQHDDEDAALRALPA